jgi:antitoxin VapB
MPVAAVFRNNRSQAVRLPKAVALPEGVTEVEITAVGRRRILAPAGAVWEHFFDGVPATSDFLATRDQPGPQVRDGL